jgi:hypothetical protein
MPPAADRGGHELLPDRPVLPIDPDGPALTTFGDDPAGAGGQVLRHFAVHCSAVRTSPGSLLPTSDSTDESLCGEAKQVVLVLQTHRCDPSGDLDAVEPRGGGPVKALSALPCAQEISRSVPPRQESDPVCPQQLQLLGQPDVEIRRAPTELPDIHEGPGGGELPIEPSQRSSPCRAHGSGRPTGAWHCAPAG